MDSIQTFIFLPTAVQNFRQNLVKIAALLATIFEIPPFPQFLTFCRVLKAGDQAQVVKNVSYLLLGWENPTIFMLKIKEEEKTEIYQKP